ncbi:MAG: hypothetical protein ACPG4N_06585 [Gammaproteobacteria bacterium]
MGLFDFLKPKTDPVEECAKRIALDAGLLDECPVCRVLTDRGAGAAAWSSAENAAKATTPGECGTPEEVMQRMRRMVDRAGTDCRCDLGAN